MRIIYLTDIHGSFERVRKLLQESIADVYIIGGDLIDIPFYNMNTAIRYDELHNYFFGLRRNMQRENEDLDDFIEDILISPGIQDEIHRKAGEYQQYTIRARRVMQQKYKILENIISAKTSYIFCLPGNYDMDLKYTSLHERDLHLRWHRIDEFNIAGYGGADIWTSGVPGKYVVKYRAGIGIDDRENEMYQFFKAVKPDIVVTHQPAHGIHDRVSYKGPSGSPALRSYCDQNSVRLCLTGHIHEDWGFTVSENTIYLNPSNFGEITVMSGDVVEGGTFYYIETDGREVQRITLKKLVETRIYDIVRHTRRDGRWTESIIDNDRLIALKKRENYDSKTVKYSHVPEIDLYNDIKEFFRAFQTRETEERIGKLEEAANLLEEKLEGIAMDVAGSVNMGLSQPSSDMDIVLYIQCNKACGDWTECSHMKKAKGLLEEILKDKYKFEIIDCIDLNLVEKSIREKNYECDSAQRFVAYRSMFRPINYKFIAPVEDLLNQDMEFRKELEGSVRAYLRILANTSRHIHSFDKYQTRINSLGIKIPRSVKSKIEQYLQLQESDQMV